MRPIPCAATGGVIIGSVVVRDAFVDTLVRNGLTPNPFVLVAEPVVGAIVLARRLVPGPVACP